MAKEQERYEQQVLQTNGEKKKYVRGCQKDREVLKSILDDFKNEKEAEKKGKWLKIKAEKRLSRQSELLKNCLLWKWNSRCLVIT